MTDRDRSRDRFTADLQTYVTVAHALRHDAVLAAEVETISRVLDVVDTCTDMETARRIAGVLAAKVAANHENAVRLAATVRPSAETIRLLADTERFPAPGDYQEATR